MAPLAATTRQPGDAGSRFASRGAPGCVGRLHFIDAKHSLPAVERDFKISRELEILRPYRQFGFGHTTMDTGL